ncbi:MAG TPA: DedA family protein [Vicinamibacterales bacterium]
MFNWIAGIITSLGYAGVAFLTFLEHVFPPIPSELILPLAGYVAASGDLTVAMVIATGTVGSLAGSTLWYAIGRKVGEQRLRAWIDQHGKWLTLGQHDIDRATAWFERRGKIAVLIGRLLPGIRTFVSLPAGFSRMPWVTFLAYSTAGTLAWTAALVYAGVQLKHNFALVSDRIDIATNVVFVVLGAMLAWRYVKCWRKRSVPRVADAERRRHAEELKA